MGTFVVQTFVAHWSQLPQLLAIIQLCIFCWAVNMSALFPFPSRSETTALLGTNKRREHHGSSPFSARGTQPKHALVVFILFTTMAITWTWKKWWHGRDSQLVVCQPSFNTKVLYMYIYSFTTVQRINQLLWCPATIVIR